MQLSSTAKYTIQILQFLANNPDKRYPSTYIANKLNISHKYLTKIMTTLTKENITNSTKGKFGGFIITKPLKEITIFDIVQIFEDIEKQQCILYDTRCDVENRCALHDKWQKPKCAIDNFFTQTTLADLNKLTTLAIHIE
jgi:Rrf2 family protein